MAHRRPRRHAGPRTRPPPSRTRSRRSSGVGRHVELRPLQPPGAARPIGVDLDAEPVRVAEVERLAHGVVGAASVDARVAEVTDEPAERGRGRAPGARSGRDRDDPDAAPAWRPVVRAPRRAECRRPSVPATPRCPTPGPRAARARRCSTRPSARGRPLADARHRRAWRRAAGRRAGRFRRDAVWSHLRSSPRYVSQTAGPAGCAVGWRHVPTIAPRVRRLSPRGAARSGRRGRPAGSDARPAVRRRQRPDGTTHAHADTRDSRYRRGPSGRRRRHLAQLRRRARQHRVSQPARRAARRCSPPAARSSTARRCTAAPSRRPASCCERDRAGAAGLPRHQGLDVGPRRRHRADGAVVRACCAPTRIDLMQVHNLSRLAHAPADAAALEGARAACATSASPTTRRRPMPRSRRCCAPSRSTSCRSTTRSTIAPPSSGCCRWPRDRGVAVIVNMPFGGGGLLRRLRDRPLPAGPPRSAAPAGPSCAEVRAGPPGGDLRDPRDGQSPLHGRERGSRRRAAPHRAAATGSGGGDRIIPPPSVSSPKSCCIRLALHPSTTPTRKPRASGAPGRALFLPQILGVLSVVTPCPPGASRPSVLHKTSKTKH